MKISVREETTLFEFLLAKIDSASKTRVRKLIRHGSVTVDGQPATKDDAPLRPGQTVEVRRPRPIVTNAPFPVLFEDRWFLAVDKPSNILSAGRPDQGDETVLRLLNAHFRAHAHRPGHLAPVHRLDREVSGVLLFAASRAAREKLHENWHEVEKTYAAIVEGAPPHAAGTIRTLLREGRDYSVASVAEGEGGKPAVTHYRVMRRYAHHTLLEVRIETGRKHQIRAHLAELGCPVAGDSRYGATTDPLGRISLHALSLAFTHPETDQRIRIESPMPRRFVTFDESRSGAAKRKRRREP